MIDLREEQINIAKEDNKKNNQKTQDFDYLHGKNIECSTKTSNPREEKLRTRVQSFHRYLECIIHYIILCSLSLWVLLGGCFSLCIFLGVSGHLKMAAA